MSKKNTSLTADQMSDKPIRARDIATGKVVLRQRSKSGALLPLAAGKQRVNIYLDTAVVEHFKSQAGGRGYQTLINETLKQSIQSESIEKTIRHTIQQELKAYKV